MSKRRKRKREGKRAPVVVPFVIGEPRTPPFLDGVKMPQLALEIRVVVKGDDNA